MIYYKANRFGDNPITEVEVEKETPSFIVIKGRTEKKRTVYDNYFSTYDEAKKYIIDRHQGIVNRLEKDLHSAKSELGKILSKLK